MNSFQKNWFSGKHRLLDYRYKSTYNIIIVSFLKQAHTHTHITFPSISYLENFEIFFLLVTHPVALDTNQFIEIPKNYSLILDENNKKTKTKNQIFNIYSVDDLQ